ncbi:MAG TPA: CPBP family intramembrane metalloprotease [Candidatus Borkfalkia excrementipullorum]|nr:CPBP family intramembrane metalloprotease [Candidatus Borkfalkia excrementipullorum]
MEQNNGAPAGGMNNPKRSLFDQPRKVISGIVFSGTIVGMVLISLVFSITLGLISSLSDTPVGELQETDAYKYFSYLLYQIVYVGIIVAFAAIYKSRPRDFGYRKVKVRYLFIALALAFGLLFSLNWVNGWFVELLSLLGYTAPESALPSAAGAGFFGVLLVVAVLPALCEETIFRGIILDGVKDIGTVAACLLGGLLFSIFHQSPTQTIYQFICGAAFTLLAIRADSIWPAILIHFVNNAVIIFDYKFDFLSKVSSGGAIAIYVISAVCLAASLVYLIFFEKKTNRKKEGAIKPFVYPALVGIILCAIMWIANFASGMMG